MVVTKEQEIAQVNVGKPHLVILGAGASLASFPNGDTNEQKLPIMDNLIEILGLQSLIAKTGKQFETTNFEEIYSQLCSDPNTNKIREEIEEAIYNYFSSLEMPNTPTIYDHLLLSLREKDVIATFNWDPFLVQAYRRNARKFKLPKLLFLHGNVEVGYCPNGHIMGNVGEKCSQCNEILFPTKLLYPIGEKNYHLNEFISRQWATLEDTLQKTHMLTIYGYGAPSSDVSAIELMKSAWGNVENRRLELIEIINIEKEDDLLETWKEFIHTHHYKIKSDFYNSWIANHPRRSYEAYINQFREGKFIENNPIPKDIGFDELWEWFGKLKDAENDL